MVLAGLGAAMAGCTALDSDDTTPTPGAGGTITPTASSVGYPHLRPSGNRVVAGAGSLPNGDPIDIELDGEPRWLAAVPAETGSLWAVVDRSETLSLLSLRDGDGTITATDTWPADRPPAVQTADSDGSVLIPPAGAGTAAPPLAFDGGVAAVADDGAVVVAREGTTDRIDAGLLADARLCRLSGRRAVALGGPTTRYDHGALGDSIEASEIVVIDLETPAVERRFSVPEPRVVEGTAPIVADLGGDRAIVVTESDTDGGARIVAYGIDGTTLASSPPIGTGFRWRHQLAVGPFGPAGEREIAVVKTPHIGGTVEFYRRRGADLTVVATVDGASSHAYGSRILDGGFGADADGDGRTELVVPDDERRQLLGVERRGDTAVVEWSVPIGGRLSSNVVGVAHDDGIAVGAGHGSTVRLWHARE